MSSRSIEEILYLSKRTIGYQDRLRLLQKLQKANIKPEYSNLIRWITFSPLIDVHNFDSLVEPITHVQDNAIDRHTVILDQFDVTQTDFTLQRMMRDLHTDATTMSIWQYLYEMTDRHGFEFEVSLARSLTSDMTDRHGFDADFDSGVINSDTDLPINLIFPNEAYGIAVRNGRMYLAIKNIDQTPSNAIHVYNAAIGATDADEIISERITLGADDIHGLTSTDQYLYTGSQTVARYLYDGTINRGNLVDLTDRFITGMDIDNNLLYVLSYENITAEDSHIDVFDLAQDSRPLLRTIPLNRRCEGMAIGGGRLYLIFLQTTLIVEVYDLPTGTVLGSRVDNLPYPTGWTTTASLPTRSFTVGDNLTLNDLLTDYRSTGMSIRQHAHKIYFGYSDPTDSDTQRIRVHSLTTGNQISDEEITPEHSGDTGSSQAISALATSSEWIYYARNFIRRVRYNGDDDEVVINLTSRFVDGMAIYRDRIYVASSQVGSSTNNQINVYFLDGTFDRNILSDSIRRTGITVTFDRIYYTTVATNEVTVIDHQGNLRSSEAIPLPAEMTSRRGMAFYQNNLYVLNENPFIIKRLDRTYTQNTPVTAARGLAYDRAHQAVYVMRNNPIQVRRYDPTPRRIRPMNETDTHTLESTITEESDIPSTDRYLSTQYRINWITANKQNYPAHSIDYDLGNATGITPMSNLNDSAGMSTDGSSVIFMDADDRDLLYPDQLTVIGWIYLPGYSSTTLNWIMGIAPYWDLTIANNSMRFRARSNLASRTWTQSYLTNAWNGFMISINLSGANKGAVFRLNNHVSTATFENTNQVNINQNNRVGIFGFDFGNRRAVSGVGMSWLKFIKGYQSTEGWYAQSLAGYTDLSGMEMITAFDFVQSYQPTPLQTAGLLHVGD